MRLNILPIFVSGGPMEAGKTELSSGLARLDLVNAMVGAGDDTLSDEEDVAKMEEAASTCGSCSGMSAANSMNCLNEAEWSGPAGQRPNSHPRPPLTVVRARGQTPRRDGQSLLYGWRRVGPPAH